MRAVRIHTYGDGSVLRYEDAPLPGLAEDELLVRVHAAAVNPVDWKIRSGFLTEWFPQDLPVILGWDLSGVVEAVGAAVTDVEPGDETFALADIARDGAYAEYIVLKATHAVPKPPALDHQVAAAMPLAGLTAWQGLFDIGNLAQGQTVLVHAAAGGVGTFAVQLAKWRGATVLGTASAGNLAFLQDLGVDEAIDYNAGPFEEVAREVDVVLDCVGGDTQDRSWTVLRPGGVLVSLVAPPSPEAAAAHGVRHGFLATQPNVSQLAELGRMVADGEVEPVVSTVLPLREVPEAHRRSETGHVRGKIVLRITD